MFGCANAPKVTLYQINTEKNIAKPYKIIEYDTKKCDAVADVAPVIPVLSPILNGGVCLTMEDYNRVKSHLQSECRKENENRKLKDE